MVETAAWVYAGLVALTCLFHLAIIWGAPWGRFTMGGRWPRRLPVLARLFSAASAMLLIVMALVVLTRAGILQADLPDWVIWTVAGFTLLSVLANAATPSAPERGVWLPVTLILLICIMIVLWY